MTGAGNDPRRRFLVQDNLRTICRMGNCDDFVTNVSGEFHTLKWRKRGDRHTLGLLPIAPGNHLPNFALLRKITDQRKPAGSAID